MKELDFLPSWYRDDRHRKQCRQRHYVLFGVVVALLVTWSFIVGHSVSGLQAETRRMEDVLEKGRQVVNTAYEMQSEIQTLNRRINVLDTLTPRTAVSAVLGELSHCIQDTIVLSRVTLVQESIDEAKPKAGSSASGVIRIGAAKSDGPSPLPDAPQRTRLVLTGVAAGGADVALLIEQLETSAYFRTVSPGFSRAKKIGDKTVTEFEIACTVADYEVKR